MSTSIPAVREYMTTFPHAVGLDQTLGQAHALMKDNDIRHLPVLERGSLVGLLTLRDVQLLETLEDGSASDLRIAYVMRKRAYAVSPETPLDEVVETMASRKLDCAVVVNSQHVVGIFTQVDLSRVCVDLLRAASRRA
jgi:acetoin utilization protein AcuB